MSHVKSPARGAVADKARRLRLSSSLASPAEPDPLGAHERPIGKARSLSDPYTYGPAVGQVAVCETHMSWVFLILTESRIYKLKNPIVRPHLEIALVDPEASDGAPGGDLALFLSRYGLSAEVTSLAGSGKRASEILRRRILDFGSDLLVMGAYGHSRLRRVMLGCVTRVACAIRRL